MKIKIILISLLSINIFSQNVNPKYEWIFSNENIVSNYVKNLFGNEKLNLISSPKINSYKNISYIEIENPKDALTEINLNRITKNISVAAWISIDKPKDWGGIISTFQDNGDFEKGWMLGYRGTNFIFGISSEGANDGNGILTYLNSKEDFVLGEWYHVVGTYNGEIQKIYVNGELKNTSFNQNGGILYPEENTTFIASYKDNDENNPLNGRLHQISVYDTEISEKEVKKLYDEKSVLREIQLSDSSDRFIVKPYLQFATEKSINIVFEFSNSIKSKVLYGETLEKLKIVNSVKDSKIHKILIDSLSSNKKYFYKVIGITDEGKEVESEILTFKTAVNDGTFAFCVVGDTQNNPEIWGIISNHIWNERPDFVLHAGDIVGSGDAKYEWVNEYFHPASELMGRVPIYHVLGNHEDDANHYYNYMVNPSPEWFYKFNYGNAEFFMIDSNRDLNEGSEQYELLENALRSSTAYWKFAVHHHPCYSSDEDDYGNAYKEIAEQGDPKVQALIELYEKYGVDLVFSGHIHDYERTWPLKKNKVNLSEGVIYIQTGGGGGGLENYAPTRSWFTAKVKREHHYIFINILDNVLNFYAYDKNWQLFDNYSLNKKENKKFFNTFHKGSNISIK